MATVRMSDELKNNITDNAKMMFADRIKSARNSYSETWGQRIYDALLGIHVPAMNALPVGFFFMTNKIGLTTWGDRHVSLEFQMNSSYPVPFTAPKDSGYDVQGNAYRHSCEMRVSASRIMSDVALGDINVEIMQWLDRIKTVEDQRYKFVSGVTSVLKVHTTLAPALRAWPPLWDLLPESTKNKHREVKERTSKGEVQIEADLGALTAMSTLIKLTK